MKKYIYLFVLLVGFSACSKYNTNINELPNWESDWILPLVKGKVSFENIKQLSNAKTSFDVPSIDIGFPSGTTTNVPAFSISEVGPYKQPLSDWIHIVNFDSLDIQLSFTNAFPIAISAGTKFSFRRADNTSDPSNLIYQHTVANDINPNQTYTFDVEVYNNYIGDTLYVFLEQFDSPGGNNVTFNTTPSKLSIEVKIIDIDRVELFANKSLKELDTLDIDFSGDETNTGADSASSGVVNFFMDNALPINFFTQVYFLDPVSNTITDSLLNTPLNAIGCSTDANGDPTNVKSTSTSVTINTSRINKIKQAKRAVISYKLNTLGYPPPYVILSDKTYLKIQITGDLHLSFNLNSL